MTPIANHYLAQVAAKKQEEAAAEPTAPLPIITEYFGISQTTAYRWLKIGTLDRPKNGERMAVINEKFHALASQNGLRDFDEWQKARLVKHRDSTRLEPEKSAMAGVVDDYQTKIEELTQNINYYT